MEFVKNIEKLVNQPTFEDNDIINSLKHEVKRWISDQSRNLNKLAYSI